jgi:predicted house-cleaning NTP pyrophosphatase (Maf/HAM1 superfamily)
MATIENITLIELQKMLGSLNLPSDTRITVTIEDNEVTEKALKREKALKAMKKLKGSGTGNLVTALLKEREKDALK